MSSEVRVVADEADLARAAASEFVERATDAVAARARFTVALSGGSTPRALYALLATDPALKSQVPWDSIHFFWGDERHVPPEHPDSNYHMASEALLSQVPVRATNVHRVKSELEDADEAALEYEQALRDCFRLGAGDIPRFDLVLLGMGPDGHTASLFPGTDALSEHQRLVVANWVEKFDGDRITLTLPVLNNAASVIFLVSGAEKAETLRAVLAGDSPEPYPAQLVQPSNGELIWLVSSDAARLLALGA